MSFQTYVFKSSLIPWHPLITLKLKIVDDFVDFLANEETDRAKKVKLWDLKLTPEEWGRVDVLISLLKVSFLYSTHFQYS